MEMVAQPQSQHEQRTVGETKLFTECPTGREGWGPIIILIHNDPFVWIETSNIIIHSH